MSKVFVRDREFYKLLLALGLPIVLKNLIDDIRGRGNAVTAGDIGYRYVVQTAKPPPTARRWPTS